MANSIAQIIGKIFIILLSVIGFYLSIYHATWLLGSDVTGIVYGGGSYICILIVVCTQKILKRISALEQNFKGKAEQKD